MKRFAVSILACIYFVASSGMLLRQHYCMGDLIETEIDFGQAVSDNTCGDCGMEQAQGSCCESKVKLVKKVDDQQAGHSPLVELQSMIADIPPVAPLAYANTPVYTPYAVTVQQLQKPPPKALPIFLEIRNLRI